MARINSSLKAEIFRNERIPCCSPRVTGVNNSLIACVMGPGWEASENLGDVLQGKTGMVVD